MDDQAKNRIGELSMSVTIIFIVLVLSISFIMNLSGRVCVLEGGTPDGYFGACNKKAPASE